MIRNTIFNSLYTLFVFLVVFGNTPIFAQQNTDSIIVYRKTDTINPERFNDNFFEQVLLNELNQALESKNKDAFKARTHLQKAAKNQAIYMAKNGNTGSMQIHRERATPALRVQMYGGSMVAWEITEKNSINKGTVFYTYEEICKTIMERIFNNSKKTKLMLSKEYNLIGVGSQLGVKNKKVFVSLVLGNYKSNNKGIVNRNKLRVPYTNNYYDLIPPYHKYCRKVNRKQDNFELQKSLTVENQTIYFETDNIKQLKKLLKNKHDGIAIDILQKEQFACARENIIDYNYVNRGILTKRIYGSKLLNKNLVNTDDNRHAFKAEIGEIPEAIRDNYELNLVLIQNKSICKIVPQSFLIKSKGKYNRTVNYQANLTYQSNEKIFKPVADSMVLKFRIPFEVNKYSYKRKDVEPFLKLLNEPEFIIYELDIRAYSSIEGSDKENIFLQEQRAKSIQNALKERQKEEIATSITTDYNWYDFKADIQNTEHKEIASLTMEEAQKYIKEKNIKEELEPILEKHRYAELKMKTRYNIEGENELPYVINKFNDAIKTYNDSLALSIQKYMIKNIFGKAYPDSCLSLLNIPQEQKYASLAMNRLYIMNYFEQIEDSTFIKETNILYQNNPDNYYLKYNVLLNKMEQLSDEELANDNSIIQNNIDRLYATSLPKYAIDALNIKYQMRLISSSDSAAVSHKLRNSCVKKLKEIVNINEETIDNSMKLAEIFINNNDYNMARNSLEQWIGQTTNEELIYTYLSLCSIDGWYMHTQKFIDAMQTAKQINKDRWCDLFFSDKFSYQVFENNEVKDMYCKTCDGEK